MAYRIEDSVVPVVEPVINDAELAALKQQYQSALSALSAAESAAEQARQALLAKAEQLDGVAQQGDNPNATNTAIYAAVHNIDFSEIAKQGTDPAATNTAILEAVEANAVLSLNREVAEGKAQIAEQIRLKGGTATADMSHAELAAAVDAIPITRRNQIARLDLNNTAWIVNSPENTIIDLGFIEKFTGSGLSFIGYSYVTEIRNIPRNMPNLTLMASAFQGCGALQTLDLTGIDTSRVTTFNKLFRNCPSLRWVDMRGLSAAGVTAQDGFEQSFQYAANIETLVGDATYEQIVAQDIRIFDGLNVSFTESYFTSLNVLNRASLRALLNGLADRTGQDSLTLQLSAAQLAQLSDDDIAVARYEKNWTIPV